jgi:Fe-Mn family superoxide dismutase
MSTSRTVLVLAAVSALAAAFDGGLPDLPYKYNALEPAISADIMKLHHDKHFATYLAKLKTALASPAYDLPSIGSCAGCFTLEELLASLSKVSDPDTRVAIQNNGGGCFNHDLFVTTMRSPNPANGILIQSSLAIAVDAAFGSFEKFKEQLTARALKIFGSGWVWLYMETDGKLSLASSPNQDSPAMDGRKVLLGIDVWEHAYYLQYKNVRPDYVKAWFTVVDWNSVGNIYSRELMKRDNPQEL